MLIDAIKMALENMEENYCALSQIDYSELELEAQLISMKKFLERPFAYEFYHQLRKLIESGGVNFGDHVIQAEVDKRYQKCFAAGKIPDFLIHLPNARENLAVIEFKLASNPTGVSEDFGKLFDFKRNDLLQYNFGIEVVIGSEAHLSRRKREIDSIKGTVGEEIIVIEFNTDIWRATSYSILYQCPNNDSN